MRAVLLTTLLLTNSVFAQDLRLIQLEQDVRNLERQVQSLTRELNALRGENRVGATAPDAVAKRRDAPAPRDWLNAANWRRVKQGMTELEVIELIGPPNTMRAENGRRVLLYAMEIGASGFLSGSVTMQDRAVVEVDMPRLR